LLNFVFKIFSSNPLIQLKLLLPFILPSIGFGLLGVIRLHRLHKESKRFIRHLVMATLGAYFGFTLLISLQNPTGTSYGAAQPVIIVFGVIYLLLLGFTLFLFSLLIKINRLHQNWKFLTRAYYAGHLALLLLLGYGAYIEPFWLDTTYTTLTAASFAPGSPPLKIVLISDLHMERWGRREDETIAAIRKLEPDLLLVSGDFINVDHYQPETYTDMHRFFMNLQARYGVYAVGGSVDDIEETRVALQDTPVHFLNNEIARLEIDSNKIEILGIPSRYRDDGQMLVELSAELNPNAYKILLYHTPDLAKEKSLANINLYLAGHTHGGQIALPFVGAIFTASRYGTEYAAGLYKLANPVNTMLYVTRGLGFEGINTPRIRLFARPEISALTLVPA